MLEPFNSFSNRAVEKITMVAIPLNANIFGLLDGLSLSFIPNLIECKRHDAIVMMEKMGNIVENVVGSKKYFSLLLI